MAIIVLETQIHADRERCFDLSRSIDIHLDSMAAFREEAVAGRTTGLIGLGETVTWRARHFSIWHQMTSKITRLDAPSFFRDEMAAGPFSRFVHDHFFTACSDGTLMTDIIRYTWPCSLLSAIPDLIIVRSHIRRLLEHRNNVIKSVAEGMRT